MPILTSTVTNRMRQVGLDAENATYYDDAQDLIPAINAAIEWLVTVINSAYSQKKISEEFFREITHTSVFQTNIFSRIKFDVDEIGENIWTILAVYPKPTVYVNSITTSLNVAYVAEWSSNAGTTLSFSGSPNTNDIIVTVNFSSGATLNDWDSLYRPELTHVEGDKDAKRLTFEEWGANRLNPFAAGNEVADSNAQYAYLAFNNYNVNRDVATLASRQGYNVSDVSNTVTFENPEIEVRPHLEGTNSADADIKRGLVSVTYVISPTTISALTDIIQLPNSCTNLLYEKALQFVSFKQGDETNIYTVTHNDIQTLVNATL